MAEEITLGDVDLTTVKARTVSGIATLISRSFLLQLVATGGFFLLSVFLNRPEIGLFIAVNDLVSILGYFSDIGLAASLVQKKEQVTLSDLRTTFTIQQTLVVGLIMLMLLLSGWIFGYYHLTGSEVWLFYSLLTAFFLASLKTIPSVTLERQVKFEIIAAVEVVETLIFYTVAVLLAWRGGGVVAYAWAVILRGIIGTVLIYYLSPWQIGFGWSKTSLKTLLSFGLPYQINTLLATIKDRFVNILLWRIIGADGVGIIGWAQTWSQKPLRFVMDNVTRVTFPSFARLQDHPRELKSAIERTLFFISALTFPMIGGLAIVAPQIVKLIPKYSKWEVALLPLSLYCFNSIWAAISTPLTNTLNALGKVKWNSYLMIMWTALTWGLTPFLAIKYGYVGVAYATAIIALTSVVPIIIVKRLTQFSLFSSVGFSTFSTLVMMGVSFWLNKSLHFSVVSLAINVILSGSIYAALMLLLGGKKLITDISAFAYALCHKA